jgi:hypothetical protein
LKNSNQEEKKGVKNLFQKKEKSSQDFDFRASEFFTRHWIGLVGWLG